MNLFEAEINLAVQTINLAIVFASLGFRMKGNYKAHVATMAVAVVLGLVITSVGTLGFSDSSYTQTLTNPTMNLTTFASHALFGIISFVSGITLLALLLIDKSIAPRSSLMAKATPILWLVAYVVGIVFLVILRLI